MKTKTFHFPADSQLTFSDTVVSPNVLSISITTAEKTTFCSLTLQISAQIHQHINKHHLFHLTPEVKGPGHQGIQSDKSVEMDVMLDDKLLSMLDPSEVNGENLTEYFLQLEQQNPLLDINHWFVDKVKQDMEIPLPLEQGESLKMVYHTIWREQKFSQQSPSQTHSGIANTLLSFLQENNWQATEVKNTPIRIFQFRFAGQNGQWDCFIEAREQDDQCVVYSIFPVPIPQEKRLLIIELANCINLNLALGNFELDMDTGALFFRTSVDVKEDRLSVALVRQLIGNNLMFMDQFLPIVQLVLDKDISPLEALAQISPS